jgi:NAD(P)H-flavin reductase
MMWEAAPAKGATAQKAAFQEPPVKFRSGRHTVIVKDVVDITPKYPETYVIRFTFENEPVFDFEPGQFISIFAEKDGKRISRPYSVASWPENKEHLELAIKVVEGGFMSNYLHRVAPGTRLASIGPLGRFVIPEPIRQDTVFVATGTGVAPFVSMLGHIWKNNLDDGLDFYVVFGVRYLYDLIYRDLFDRWAKEHSNFHFYPTISRPETPDWKGRVGYVQKILQEEIRDHANKQVYICGLHDMVGQVKALCQNLGFGHVRFEKWD